MRSRAPVAVAAIVLVLAGCAASSPGVAPSGSPATGFVGGCFDAGHGAWPSSLATSRTDFPPLPTVEVEPEYPAVAREAGVQGTVVVVALVCEHGRVVDARISLSIPMLDAAAIRAVAQWRFEPPMFEGKPTAAWTEVPIRFSS